MTRRRSEQLFTCIQISQPSIETRCERCEPMPPIRWEVIKAEEFLEGWRPLAVELERIEAEELRK